MFGRAFTYTLAGSQSVRYSSGKVKELGLRIKSTTNIQKITKTMNMISSAKYAKAVKELNSARAFGAAGAGAVTAMSKNEGYSVPDGPSVVILCSSDRGMCGALHTNLARAADTMIQEKDDTKIVSIGDKTKVALNSMGHDKRYVVTAKEVGRTPPTFGDAAAVSLALLDSDYDWKSGKVLYNFHKSAMTQEIEEKGVASLDGLSNMAGIEAYDSVDEDVLRSFTEFALASTIYGCLKENYISEQAARMIAMDGASKNATDMIEKMTLQYNRLRQAVITTELCEIIAGMAAL